VNVVRQAAGVAVSGPSPWEAVFEAIRQAEPHRLLDIGPGRGELTERIAALGIEVTEAAVGDLQGLPFADGSFHCVLAAWRLDRADDVDFALREIRRVLHPEGRLVAATNSEQTLAELWDLLEHGPRSARFSAESGQWPLLRYFTIVARRDIRDTVTFPDREAAHQYIASSPTGASLAERLPYFEGPLHAQRHAVVFVAEP
jgi:SAM-dependent methyltransferase